jgi:adenine C2-methylase RlmN of 23S rRNA A2503 and tRNA A37
MGEPLNNWEPVKAAVRAMVDPNRFGLKRSKVRRRARARRAPAVRQRAP